MKVATLLRSLFVTAALGVTLAATAGAVTRNTISSPALTPEGVSGSFGNVNATPDGAAIKSRPGTINALTTIYDNTASPALFAVSSTDLTSIWGDELFTAASGILDSHKFTIYNSSSSAGPLLTAQVGIEFYDGITFAPLGAYTTNINFGAGLPVGFFSTVSVTGLSGLLINLVPTDIIVLQYVISKTGTANRLGIVSLDPPTVGASPSDMYIDSATIGGGVAGFYTFGNGPANPGHQLVCDVVVTPTKGTTWGKIKNLYK